MKKIIDWWTKRKILKKIKKQSRKVFKNLLKECTRRSYSGVITKQQFKEVIALYQAKVSRNNPQVRIYNMHISVILQTAKSYCANKQTSVLPLGVIKSLTKKAFKEFQISIKEAY